MADNNKKKYIKYEDTTYILEDSRLPDPSSADNGKVLGIVNGAYALKQEQGGGGSGTVTSVNNVQPDSNGNVSLSANDVGAGTYSKPSGGIPASDLAAGVIPDISGKQDAPLIGSVGDSTAADYVTPTQVYNALLAGKDVIINYSDMDFSGIYFTAWGAGIGVVAASIVSRFVSDVVVTLTGTISNDSWSLDTVALVDGNRLARVATTGSYDDLSDKPTIPTVPTNVSAFQNDAGYLTAHQDISGKADKIPRIAKTASDTTATIEPNKLYVFPEMATLTPTLATPSDNTIVNEYHFVFDSGATATTLTLPASVLQPDGFTVEANMHYEISILEGAMTAQGWAVTSA